MLISYDLLDVLYLNFCKPLRINAANYIPMHDTAIENLSWQLGFEHNFNVGPCYFKFEEPLNIQDLSDLSYTVSWGQFNNNKNPKGTCWGRYLQILANSEKSTLKKQWLKGNNTLDWYFFYHGFAALFWYDRFKYVPIQKRTNFTHVFITYNHILNYNRSYRLSLISQVLNKNLDQFGLISAPLLSDKKMLLKELTNPNTQLTAASKLSIYKTLLKNSKKFVLDYENPHGKLSANINLKLNQQAFCHVVTETVFYGDALHLTEKIFKPIVSMQPFLLVAAPGNLQYLQSYGFKTFDKWWNEDYDIELDADKRIEKIVSILEKLSKMSHEQLVNLYNDMYDILEFNFNHFYKNFKHLIVNELVDNFEKCLDVYNHDLSERFTVDKTVLNFAEIKKRLLS